ncbi:uncharacterized protein LOC113007926 isoform X1 [Astatotilapia calliptera]|uniref:uncharacterized protein LOC113007926 isoform X1 n=1 Tax=Astatotilapia calliptera TaxID=8154 RepID=UPI000E41CC96|nr:uncharacterized protein LOC113007926 isoform X1 [Astatotilapia calliptera]
MRLRALWMVVMVCFSDGEGTECSGGPVISVTESSKVMFPCPRIQASEMKYQLIFNDKPISKVSLDKNHTAQFEVTVSESGVYSCITEKIYPPPYKQSCQRIQVNVTGKTRTHKLIKKTIAFHSVCEIMNCLIVSMFVCLSLCVTQVSLLCPFTSCMSKSSVFLGVVRAPDAVRSVCSMSSFLYDRVCCVRVHLPPTYMPNSDIKCKKQ